MRILVHPPSTESIIAKIESGEWLVHPDRQINKSVLGQMIGKIQKKMGLAQGTKKGGWTPRAEEKLKEMLLRGPDPRGRRSKAVMDKSALDDVPNPTASTNDAMSHLSN